MVCLLGTNVAMRTSWLPVPRMPSADQFGTISHSDIGTTTATHSSTPASEQMAGVRNQLAKRQPLANDVWPSIRKPPSTRCAFIGLLELAATTAYGSLPHNSSTSTLGQVAADNRAAFATMRNHAAQLSSRATAC